MFGGLPGRIEPRLHLLLGGRIARVVLHVQIGILHLGRTGRLGQRGHLEKLPFQFGRRAALLFLLVQDRSSEQPRIDFRRHLLPGFRLDLQPQFHPVLVLLVALFGQPGSHRPGLDLVVVGVLVLLPFPVVVLHQHPQRTHEHGHGADGKHHMHQLHVAPGFFGCRHGGRFR